MNELINNLINIEKDHKKHSKLGKDLERIISILVHTIYFLDLYYNLDPKNQAFLKTLKNYSAHRAENAAELASSREADMVIRNLNRRYLEEANMVPGDLMDLAYVNTVQSALLSNGTTDRSFSVFSDYGFLYPKLLTRVIAGGDDALNIVMMTLNQLKSMPAQLYAQPILANSTVGNVMAFMYFLKQILRTTPIMDTSLLTGAIRIVEAFTTWPMPMGGVAEKLHKMLVLERAVSGCNLRKLMLEENPLLDSYGYLQAEKWGFRGADWARTQRSVAVVVDKQIPRSVLMEAMLFTPMAKGAAFNQEMHQARVELLVLLFQGLLENTNTPSVKVWRSKIRSVIQNREIAQVEEWYNDALEATGGRELEIHAFDAAHRAESKKKLKPGEEMLEHRRALVSEKKLLAVLSDVSQGMAQGTSLRVQRSANARRKSKKDIQKNGSSARGFRDQSTMTVEADTLKWDTTTPYTPSLEFQFEYISDSMVNEEGGGGVGAMGTRSSQIDDDIFANMPAWGGGDEGEEQVFAYLPGNVLERRHDFQSLKTQLEAAMYPDSSEGDDQEQKEASKHRKPVVKRVLMGNNKVLHHASQAHVAMSRLHGDLLEKVDLRYYVVPIGRNDLASYLAHRDGWYRKHIYCQFYAPLLMCPQVKPSREEIAANDGNPWEDLLQVKANGETKTDHPGGGMFVEPETEGVTTRGHTYDASPAKMLRHILTDFVRGAESELAVQLYTCECWTDPGAMEQDVPTTPSITIPFCTRAELGLGAAVAKYVSTEDVMGNFVGQASAAGLGSDPSLDELLHDKSFVKEAIATPEVVVSVERFSHHGHALPDDENDRVTLSDHTYLSLTLNSMPRFTLPLSDARNKSRNEYYEPSNPAADPQRDFLEVSAVPAKSLPELFQKKGMKESDLQKVKDALGEGIRYYVGVVDVKASSSSPIPFEVALDGVLYGPFFRIRVTKCEEKMVFKTTFPVG